jgi:hypothetical protein
MEIFWLIDLTLIGILKRQGGRQMRSPGISRRVDYVIGTHKPYFTGNAP